MSLELKCTLLTLVVLVLLGWFIDPFGLREEPKKDDEWLLLDGEVIEEEQPKGLLDQLLWDID